MNTRTTTFALISCACLGAACVSGGHWSQADALGAEKIEMQVDREGRPVEIEYHITPDQAPAAVRAAMDKLHPGGRAVAGEKETVDGTLYWELSKEVDGLDVEAMFLPDGTLHSEEVEVRAASVPAAVRAAATARFGAELGTWEEIRDGDRKLVEYHAKGTKGGKNYKLRLGLDGAFLGMVREVPAEIEVPVD